MTTSRPIPIEFHRRCSTDLEPEVSLRRLRPVPRDPVRGGFVPDTDPRIKFLRAFLSAMGETSRVTERGQTTIPQELREKYGIEPGDEVVWEDTEDGLVVKKRGALHGYGAGVPEGTDDEVRADVAAELDRRLRERRDRNYEESDG